MQCCMTIRTHGDKVTGCVFFTAIHIAWWNNKVLLKQIATVLI